MTRRAIALLPLLIFAAAAPARAEGIPGAVTVRGSIYMPGGDLRNGGQKIAEAPLLILPQGSTLDLYNLDVIGHNVASGDPAVDGIQGDGLFRSNFANLYTASRQSEPVTGVEALGPGAYRFFCQNHPGEIQGTLTIA